jgi:hypothetical protein
MKKLSTLTIVVLALLLSLTTLAVPKLNSLPGTSATIFLDFDGHYVYNGMWNNGLPLTCATSGMTDLQITEVFNRTAEDFRPFDVNITTDSTVFLAAPLNKRIRIIVTPTSAWYQGVGGVSYVGSFVWGDDTPGFVFCDRLGPNNPKMVAEACSHESGHAVGLSHQSRYDGINCTTPIETYNSGTGTGEVAWAPIMGNSYARNLSNWNNGPTPYGCTNIQDNLSIITTQNGFGYRADDYAETLNASTTALTGNFTKSGIITTNTDKDAFKITVAQTSNFHLNADPYSVGPNNSGANLDIKLQVFNAAGTLINTYDPATTMSVVVDTVFNAGTYYIKIDGTGNTNVGEYGSLGSYTLSGINSPLPIHAISLSGTTDNKKHNLAWQVFSDEPVQAVVIESSTDGIAFNSLNAVAVSANQFSYTPFENSTIYYRLKINSLSGQIVYSNTVALKGITNADNIFKVSTLIQNEITVHAPAAYQYQISDINGRVVTKGNGTAGFNNISFYNQPGGMYIIQLYSKNQQQTERIIKQ